MNTQRTDFLVGLFILVMAGIVIGALIVTSGLGEVRHDFYLHAASAQDITQDTRVLVQGLNVGRVRQVNPVVNAATSTISFVARFSVQDHFPNGTKLQLPVGTRAVISQPTPIAPAVIELVVPAHPTPGLYLAAGDTIASDRPRSALDAISDIATTLSGDVTAALDDARALMKRTNHTIGTAESMLAEERPQVTTALQRLSSALDRTNQILAEVTPRVGPLSDSVSATLADTRRLVQRMDSLVTVARAMAVDNGPVIRETAKQLQRSAEILEHFADQVSRRPTRLITGVRPPPPDSSREHE